MWRYVPAGIILAGIGTLVLWIVPLEWSMDNIQWIIFLFLSGIIIIPALLHGVLGRPFKKRS